MNCYVYAFSNRSDRNEHLDGKSMSRYFDDDALIKRVMDGDEDLFGELISRHQGLVYGLAYAKIGNSADAQDIAQDVFIKAYRKLDQLDTPENFTAWLKTITANECKNWLRQRKSTIPLDDAALQASFVSRVTVTEKNRELRTELLRSVDALPESSRTVITLFYLSGLSYEEIGESLCIPVATVANRMLRARRQLKAELMSRVESEMTSLRLPDTFAKEVLTRLTLYPIDPGRTFGTKSGDEGILVIGVPGGQSHILLLAMSREGMEAIEYCYTGDQTMNSKIGELIAVKESMDASRIKAREVVLYLDKQSSCHARMIVMQRKTEKTLDLKVSDALFLAFRSGIPVVAESNLLSKGIIGTDGVSYEILHNLHDFRSDLPLISQRGRLDNIAFTAAPLSIRGNHSVRCTADFDSDTIHLFVLDTDIAVDLDLDSYLMGFGNLCKTVDKPNGYQFMEDDDGKFFRVSYSAGNGEVLISFSPYEGTPDW